MNPQVLYQWQETIARHCPVLNSWQVAVVGLLSYGVTLAESSQQRALARKIMAGERLDSAERRVRRFVGNTKVVVTAWFGCWVGWVLGALGLRQVTLLVDETKLHDKLGVMVVGVAWQARCLPLVWRVYKANDAAAYPAEGQVEMIINLLKMVEQALPATVETVLVLADRGLGTSPALCQGVADLGWKYLFRVTGQTKLVTPQGDYTIAAQVQSGQIWYADGLAFKQRGRLPARAIALWSEGYNQPWALVTNDPTLTGHEYARRNWQEQAFRDLKSGGWHWNDSQITQPDHMARFLIVLVMAYVWMLALGSQAVQAKHVRNLIHRQGRPPARYASLFKDGLDFLVDVLQRASTFFGLIFLPDIRFT